MSLSYEQAIMGIIEKADYQGPKALKQVFDSMPSEDKPAAFSFALYACLQFMNAHSADTRQYRSSSMILGAWKLDCPSWETQFVISALEAILSMVQAGNIINAPITELFEALIHKVSRLGELIVNGQESNGDCVASSFLIGLLDCNWTGENILQIVFLFKNFLPSASKSFDKKFFEKLAKDVELPKEVSLQSTIAYHLVVILERSGNPQLFPIFFRIVKQKIQTAVDIYDSILMAVNTSTQEYLIEECVKTVRSLDNPLWLAFALKKGKMEACVKIWKLKTENWEKVKSLAATYCISQTEKNVVEEWHVYLSGLLHYMPIYEEDLMNGLIHFLYLICSTESIDIIELVSSILEKASQFKIFPFEKMVHFPACVLTKIHLEKCKRVEKLHPEFLVKLLEAQPEYFTRRHELLVLAANRARLVKDRDLIEAYLAIIRSLNCLNPDEYFAQQQLCIHLLAIASTSRKLLYSIDPQVPSKVFAHAIYLRTKRMFPDFGFVPWQRLVGECVREDGWFPLGTSMIMFLKAATQATPEEQLVIPSFSKDINLPLVTTEYTKRMNDLTKRLLDPNYELLPNKPADPQNYSVAMDLCMASVLWVTTGQYNKNLQLKTLVKLLLKRFQRIYESICKSTDLEMPIVPDFKTCEYLSGEGFMKIGNAVSVMLRKVIGMGIFKPNENVALCLRLCEQSQTLDNYELLAVQSGNIDEQWLKHQLEGLCQNVSPKEPHLLQLLNICLKQRTVIDVYKLISKNIFSSVTSTKRIYERLIRVDLFSGSRFMEKMVQDAQTLLGVINGPDLSENLPAVGSNLKSLSFSNIDPLLQTLCKVLKAHFDDWFFLLRNEKTDIKGEVAILGRIIQVVQQMAVCIVNSATADLLLPVLLAVFEYMRKRRIIWCLTLVEKIRDLIRGIYLMIPAQQQLEQQAWQELQQQETEPSFVKEKENKQPIEKEAGKKKRKKDELTKDVLIERMEREAVRIPKLVLLIDEYQEELVEYQGLKEYVTERVCRTFRIDQQEMLHVIEEQEVMFNNKSEDD